MDLFNWLFNSKPPDQAQEPVPLPRSRPTYFPASANTDYPDREDIYNSKVNDLAYGDPVEPYINAMRGTKVQHIPMGAAGTMFGRNTTNSTSRPLDKDLADDIHKAWLASRRSSVAQLGFNPRETVTSDEPGTKLVLYDREGKKEGMLGGFYNPTTNKTWFDRSLPATQVHESMHRGISMMRKEGLLPFDLPHKSEEFMVRALMQRHLGDLESKEMGGVPEDLVGGASTIAPEQMDQLEKAAGEYMARKRPMGPR